MTEFDSVKTIMLNMSFSEIVELSKENAELRKKIKKQKMLIDAFKMRESFRRQRREQDGKNASILSRAIRNAGYNIKRGDNND